MSVLAIIDTINGSIQRSAPEVITMAKKYADKAGTEVHALCFNPSEPLDNLIQYGANKLVKSDLNFKHFDPQAYSKIIQSYCEENGINTVFMAHSSSGKALAGYLAVINGAECVSGIIDVPETSGNGVAVKRNVFSGKAKAHINIDNTKQVFTLMGNSIKPETQDSTSEILQWENNTSSSIKSINIDTVSGTVPLPEAELVVSAGRGMKGPENWGIIEKLADTLGATLACSRPVADTGWRPHHEHVGQTGVAIRPNLYIAAGISGAIQHLAGVNQSKCIVVINKDPEAPFFKAADYGVCADLFDVVPKLTAALEKINS